MTMNGGNDIDVMHEEMSARTTISVTEIFSDVASR